MLVNVIENGKELSYELSEGSTILDLLRLIDKYPDSYIAMKDSTPVPMTERLSEGQIIKLVKVASGG
jgi:sulfur carrier protein ThiS